MVISEYARKELHELNKCLESCNSHEDAEAGFAWLFRSMTLFFAKNHSMSSESNSFQAGFNQEYTEYIVKELERVFEALMEKAAWRIGDVSLHFTVEMVFGGVMRIATDLWQRPKDELLDASICKLSQQTAEKIMIICNFPELGRARIMKKLREYCRELLKESTEYAEKSVCQSYNVHSLRKLIEKLSMKFDIVRVVDPTECHVLYAQANGRIVVGEKCHGVWMREERCENCISVDSLRDQKPYDKFEILGDDLFQISTIPIVFRNSGSAEVSCVVECVNVTPKEKWLAAFSNKSTLRDAFIEERNSYEGE